jgi:PAS domain S-box-containing protein
MPLLTTTAQQIALRERRLHELFEFTPDAIVMSDSSGTIRETNRQAEVVFGYDPEGLIGQQVEVLMPYPSSGPTVSQSLLPPHRPPGSTESHAEQSIAIGRRRDGSEFETEELAESLVRSYPTASWVRLTTKVEPIEVTIDDAVPLGLIVNELISNALKHGFRDGRGGKLRIEGGSSPEDGLYMVVADSGSGLPAEFSLETTTSTGLLLIDALVHQIRGRLSFESESESGTTFLVTASEVTS